jgi:alpha/beta superfamily hydrolase
MDNKVVYTLMRSCLKSGLATLRFNFRGVGRSEGDYDAGRGETDDAAAAAEWLQRQQPGLPLLIAGFSFGAAVALRLALRSAPAGLVTVAMPTNYFDSVASPGCPWLAVYGSGDDVIDADASMAALSALDDGPRIEVLDGAGHFFHGRLGEVDRLVAPFCAQHVS